MLHELKLNRRAHGAQLPSIVTSAPASTLAGIRERLQ